MQMIHYLKKIYSWLLPYQCVLCGNTSLREQDLCEPCYKELPILTHSCKRCARQIASELACGFCSTSPPPFDATYALCSYKKPVTRLILTLKFNQALIYAKILGELLTNKITTDWYRNNTLPEIIIPMPLHDDRLKERGFNQAVEIARPIAGTLKIPIDTTSCQRIKYTVAQATLAAEKRSQNIKNAFRVTGDIHGKHIAILDDVITTGSTITEFAHVLKEAGAKRIDIWCCARAVL